MNKIDLRIDYDTYYHWWRVALGDYAVGSAPTFALAMEALQLAIDRRRAEGAEVKS